MLPLLPAPKPTAGDVRLVLLQAWRSQVSEAEQATDTCPFKTTAGFVVRGNSPPLPCPAIRLTGKAVGRFFCPDLWHGILQASHLANTCNAVSVPLSLHTAYQCCGFCLLTTGLWFLIRWHESVLSDMLCRPDLWDSLEQDTRWHGWLVQTHQI